MAGQGPEGGGGASIAHLAEASGESVVGVDEVAVWRRVVLERALWTTAIVLALVIVAVLAQREPDADAAAIRLMPGLSIVVAALAWRKAPDALRASGLVVGFFAAVFLSALRQAYSVPNPFVGSAFICTLVAIVLPRRWAWLTVGSCLVVWGFVAFTFMNQPVLPTVLSDPSMPGNWARILVVFTLLTSAGVLSVQFMVTRLESALTRTRSLYEALVLESAKSAALTGQREQLQLHLYQKQKLEALGQLAGGVAHDFRNLLTIIQGNTELLGEEELANQERQEAILDILAATEQATSLTRQLLAFSRTESLELLSVEALAPLRRTAELLRHILPRSVNVAYELPSELPRVHCIATAIDQIVINLAVNARDAMPQGGTLTLRAAKVTRAHVDDGVVADFVMMSVSDTGVGMDEETRGRAFEPFFTTKPLGKGTGFGLSLIHGLATQSGGFVELESTPSVGTTVSVYLPVDKGEVRKPVLNSRAPTAGSTTILIVDDDERVRHTIQRHLTRAGYRTLAAANGDEGLSQFRLHHNEIDLVITDVVMPGLSGREVEQELQKLSGHVPVLVCSGYGAQLLGEAVLEKPGRALLAKPFSARQLMESVEELLGQSRSAWEQPQGGSGEVVPSGGWGGPSAGKP